jgi:hypothetical protein
MILPEAFDEQDQALVIAAKLSADMRLQNNSASPYIGETMPPPGFKIEVWVRARLLEYVLATFASFAKVACKLGREKIWPVLRIQNECEKFLSDFTLQAVHDYRYLNLPQIFYGGVVNSDVMRDYKLSSEWSQFQSDLLMVAQEQSEAPFIYFDPKSKTFPSAIPEVASQAVNPPTQPSTQTQSERFPNRANWLSQCLKDRAWDKNSLRVRGGPDRKTIQKMLDGEPVSERSIEKTIVALNKKSKPGSELLDRNVPSD